MKKLAQYDRNKLIDLLTERLTFERIGVDLYDTVLQKMSAMNDPQIISLVPEFSRYRDDEAEHVEWLELQISALGGDTAEKTELARLIERESSGIEDVVKGDAQLAHLIHALLTAELVDNAGWQLLLELADEADDDEARSAIRFRLHQEEDHLILVRRVATMIARTQILGRQQSLVAVL